MAFLPVSEELAPHRAFVQEEQEIDLMRAFVCLDKLVKINLPDLSFQRLMAKRRFEQASPEMQTSVIKRIFLFNRECAASTKEPGSMVEKVNTIAQKAGLLSYSKPLKEKQSQRFLARLDPQLFHKVWDMASPLTQHETEGLILAEIRATAEKQLLGSLVPIEASSLERGTALHHFAEAAPDVQICVLERTFAFTLQYRALVNRNELAGYPTSQEEIRSLINMLGLGIDFMGSPEACADFMQQVDSDLFQKLWSVAPEAVKRQIKEKQFQMKPPFLFQVILKEDNELLDYLLTEGFTAQLFYLGKDTELNVREYDTLLAFTKKLFPRKHSLVERIKTADNGFTDKMLQVKLLGHRLNFKGFNFEGMKSLTVQHAIYDSIRKWALEYFPLMDDKKFSDFISEIFKNNPQEVNLLFEQALENTSTIFTGWKNHATICILSSNICIKINTGSENKPGIRFFYINNQSEKALKTVIDGLIKIREKDVSIGQNFFDKIINTQLKLEEFAHIPMKQKGGHCAWVSCKAAFKALLFLQKAKEKNQILDRKFIESVSPSVEEMFLNWELWDLNQAIRTSMSVMKEYPHYFDQKELQTKFEQELAEQGGIIKERELTPLEQFFKEVEKTEQTVELLEDKILSKAKARLNEAQAKLKQVVGKPLTELDEEFLKQVHVLHVGILRMEAKRDARKSNPEPTPLSLHRRGETRMLEQEIFRDKGK